MKQGPTVLKLLSAVGMKSVMGDDEGKPKNYFKTSLGAKESIAVAAR